MGKPGRKRKQGKRTESDRLSRAGVKPEIARPSDWVKAMQDRYGPYYSSAIGRAFASGLLGEGNEAKDRLDKARRFVALYGRILGKDRYRCPLSDTPRGIAIDPDWQPTDREIEDQEWLLVNLARIDETGCRPFFDQLTNTRYTDYGPEWLDRLLDAPRDRRDTMVLDAAVKAIDAIGPVGKAVVRNRLDKAA